MSLCTDHNICINNALQQAELICQNKGERLTALRRKVLELIWENHNPAKAYDIMDKLGDTVGSAKPSTVYRTLDFLLKNKFIHKLNSLNSYVGCAHPCHYEHCYFLICQSCGEVTECCDDKLSCSIASTANENKFTSQNIALEIEGHCQNCTRKTHKAGKDKH
jgi:Fur family zinc uptake transcriptional regulator